MYFNTRHVYLCVRAAKTWNDFRFQHSFKKKKHYLALDLSQNVMQRVISNGSIDSSLMVVCFHFMVLTVSASILLYAWCTWATNIHTAPAFQSLFCGQLYIHPIVWMKMAHKSQTQIYFKIFLHSWNNEKAHKTELCTLKNPRYQANNQNYLDGVLKALYKMFIV